MTMPEPAAYAESFRVYAEYTHVPPHPGPQWTRFVCISDTHSRKYPVPPGDVLLHAGDLSIYGSLSYLNKTMTWLQNLPHPLKIIIAGNHDLCLDTEWTRDSVLDSDEHQKVESAQALMKSTAILDAGIRYLQHQAFEFVSSSGKQWKVYGSPAAMRYHGSGAFQYETTQEADAVYDRIPEDIEILLTHTPPYGTLDLTRREKRAGCPRLSARLSQLNACRLHVFGHIHESHGVSVADNDSESSSDSLGRVSVNAALAWGGQAVIVDMI